MYAYRHLLNLLHTCIHGAIHGRSLRHIGLRFWILRKAIVPVPLIVESHGGYLVCSRNTVYCIVASRDDVRPEEEAGQEGKAPLTKWFNRRVFFYLLMSGFGTTFQDSWRQASKTFQKGVFLSRVPLKAAFHQQSKTYLGRAFFPFSHSRLTADSELQLAELGAMSCSAVFLLCPEASDESPCSRRESCQASWKSEPTWRRPPEDAGIVQVWDAEPGATGFKNT